MGTAMGALADLRAALVADLAPLGIPVHPGWPEELVVPCAFVAPPLDGGYIAAGPHFGEYTMTVDLVIMVDHAPAEQGFAALEALIETALKNTVDWVLRGVDAPAPVAVTEGGAEYLGTVLHLSKPTRL